MATQLPRTQVDAFDRKHPSSEGRKDVRFAITFGDNRRSILMRGTERRALTMFWDASESQEVINIEAEDDDGYYTIKPNVMSCDCGDGFNCELVVKVDYGGEK